LHSARSWPKTSGFREAIIAEPTKCEAVLAHRGISSVQMKFRGHAGHASGVDALHASALHNAMRWGSAALEFVESQSHQRFGGLTGLRFNIGRVEGGIKANMIAPSAEVRFGFRPLPSMPIDALHEHFRSLHGSAAIESYQETFHGPSLPSGNIAGAELRRLEARDLADALELPIGNAVDFWTEASLFSAAGADRDGLWPGRHRPGPHRRRMGRARPAFHRCFHLPAPAGAMSMNAPHALLSADVVLKGDRGALPVPRTLHAEFQPTMTDMRNTIVRLLSNMASAKEIQQYLKRFSQVDASRFAVVKVGGAVLRDDIDALVSSLAFLQQVGLTPIVVHGAGPQLDEEMKRAGIEKRTVNNLRVTDGPVLAVVRRVMREENLKLVEALQAQGVRATSIQSGVFEAEFLDRDVYELVGKVTRVDTDGIQAAIKVESIPVIASLAETADGQIVNVNADWAANELIKTLQPYKIVFLTGTGGLLDEHGKVIDSINLSTEYEHLVAQPWIHGGMKVKIEQIKDLLDVLPLSSSVSITRPAELAKELFTHRGSGTLVRRGERVLSVEHWDRARPRAPAQPDRIGLRPQAAAGLLRAHEAASRLRQRELPCGGDPHGRGWVHLPGQVRRARRGAGRGPRPRRMAGHARRESAPVLALAPGQSGQYVLFLRKRWLHQGTEVEGVLVRAAGF
jgi:acetylglutamate kinase